MASIGLNLLVDTILPIKKNAVVVQNTAMACCRGVGGFLDWNVYGEVNTNPYDAGALKVRAGFEPENKVQQFQIPINTANRTIAPGAHVNFFIKDDRYNEGDWLSAQASVSAVNTDLNLNVVPYFETTYDNGWVKVFNESAVLMDGTFHLNIAFPNRVKEGSLLP